MSAQVLLDYMGFMMNVSVDIAFNYGRTLSTCLMFYPS